MNEREFQELLTVCDGIAGEYPSGLVFIGGIAVYLHAINCAASAEYAETTHDADFYISLADMADLRDLEEVTPNRRLGKHQLVRRGFEFDIYTERMSRLIVPYDDVFASAETYGAFKVASIEHLIVLKLAAYGDRRMTAKGDKDARDIARLLMVSVARGKGLDHDKIAVYLGEQDVEHIGEIARGPAASALARGNAMTAKRIRSAIRALHSEQAKSSGIEPDA